MDVQILKEFVDLAYTLNYSKTAERMYVGQSTLSKHIIALEKELGGIQLFLRNKQSVQLTELGKAFLPHIQKSLLAYDNALEVVRNSTKDLKGTLRIGFLDGVAKHVLPGAIQHFNEIYPNIHFNLMCGQVGDILNAYDKNAIDIAITLIFPNVIPPVSAEIYELKEESISVAFPKGHPLESKDRIYIDDLLQYPLILPSPQQFSDYAKMLSAYVEKGPIRPNIICDYTHVDTAIIMIEANIGIAILPSNVAPKAQSAIFRQIEDCHPSLRAVIVWNRDNHTPGRQEFIDILIQEMKK